jgi:hypothetical protein
MHTASKPPTRKKRTPKKGYVYLLQSMTDIYTYKYGCTRHNPEARCKTINKIRKGLDFKLISVFRSNDIFKSESNVKWEVINSFKIIDGELFPDLDGIGRDEVIKIFLTAGGVIK